MMHLFENGWVSYVCQAFIRPMRTLNRTMLDLFVDKVFKGSRSSRRKFFPRTNFSGGITSLTQLASHEWIGVLLTILMAAQTHMGARILSRRLHNSDAKFLEHAKSVADKRKKRSDDLRFWKRRIFSNATKGGIYSRMPKMTTTTAVKMMMGRVQNSQYLDIQMTSTLTFYPMTFL
jgi:hypothetical protein